VWVCASGGRLTCQCSPRAACARPTCRGRLRRLIQSRQVSALVVARGSLTGHRSPTGLAAHLGPPSTSNPIVPQKFVGQVFDQPHRVKARSAQHHAGSACSLLNTQAHRPSRPKSSKRSGHGLQWSSPTGEVWPATSSRMTAASSAGPVIVTLWIEAISISRRPGAVSTVACTSARRWA
jgi:hypothetical protein